MCLYVKNIMKQNISVLQKIKYSFWCISLYSYSHYILWVSKEAPCISSSYKVDNLRRFRTEKRISLNKRNIFQNWKMIKTTVLKNFLHHFCRISVQVSFSKDLSTTHYFSFFNTIRYAQKWQAASESTQIFASSYFMTSLYTI